MWFNNALVYRYELKNSVDFNEVLAEEALVPCPPHARFIYGWLPNVGDILAQEVAGTTLLCLGKEERILPKAVINRALEERLQALEEKEQRQPTRSERGRLAEELEFELLPKAFCLQKRLLGILDSNSNRLIINTSSETQAAQFTSLLRKSIPDISIEPIEHAENISSHFSSWVQNPQQLPPQFDLASDCLLFSPEDEKKRVACKGYELPANEVLTLLKQGLAPAELSLTWNERIQFTLTHDFTIKRIKCLDYLNDEFHQLNDLENEHEQADAALVLLAGELRALINDLLAQLPTNQTSKEKVEELEAA